MRDVKFKTLFVIVTGFFALSSSKAEDHFTLSVAYQQALKYSPAIKAALSQQLVVLEGSRWVSARRFPRLRYRSSVSRGDDPVYVFGSLLHQGKFSQENFSVSSLNKPPYLTNYKNALDVVVPVFTGLELSDQKELAQLAEQKAQSQRRLAELKVGLQVMDAYLKVLSSKTKKKILAERVRTAKIELTNAKKLMKKGLVLGSDYYAAVGLHNQLKASLRQEEAFLNSAIESLRVITDRKSLSLLDVRGHLIDPSYPRMEEANLLAKAFRRPDMKIARLETQMARRQKKLASRTLIPRVYAVGSIETNTEDFSKNPSHRMGGLQLETPLGDPTYFVRQNRSRWLVEAADARESLVRDQIKNEILSLRYRYDGLIKSIPPIKTARENARRSLEMFRPLYREGKQSVLDVLRAEDALAKAELAYQDILFSAHLTHASLKEAQGDLTEDDIRLTAEQIVETVP